MGPRVISKPSLWPSLALRYEVFCRLRHLITGSYDDMVEGLGTMDRDTSGLVSSAELRLVLMNIGDKMTEDLIDPILGPHEDSTHHVVYRDMIRRVMAG